MPKVIQGHPTPRRLSQAADSGRSFLPLQAQQCGSLRGKFHLESGRKGHQVTRASCVAEDLPSFKTNLHVPK
jgi:hypothetical protein